VTRRELISRLYGERGPLTILPWWHKALLALDDPTVHELLLKLSRQSGKSQLLMAMAMSELLLVPGSYTLLVAASRSQQQAIFERKLRRPLERLLRHWTTPITFTNNGAEVPSTGTALEILAANESTAPARTVSLLLLDEARYIADDVFTVLAPSVIGAGGKIVVASTAGPPSGFFFELLNNPTPGSWRYESAINENPHADAGVLGFLSRRLRLLFPNAARRELDNEFAEDGDSFLPAALIEAAVDDGLSEFASSQSEAAAFLDLSRKKDLTSRVVVLREPPRRPEAGDHVVVASIAVWDPRQSPTGETNFAEVRADLETLPQRFPMLTSIQVDEGAEAGSILPWAQAHPQLSLLVTGFVATVESNLQMWSALSARLHAGTLSLPRHERLLSELRSLRAESFALGAKWRVVDSSRKLHRDVSLSLAGAVHALGDGSLWSPHALQPWAGTGPGRMVADHYREEQGWWSRFH
jgi:hypothetical protein